MGREPLSCQSAGAASQAFPCTAAHAVRPLVERGGRTPRRESSLEEWRQKGGKKKSRLLLRAKLCVAALRRGDEIPPRPKPSVFSAGWRAPAQWLPAGGCLLVVVVTGEAAVGGCREPGWGRKRVVGAERGPRPPARSHGKMRQVKACAGALLYPTEVSSRVWAGAGCCTSL